MLRFGTNPLTEASGTQRAYDEAARIWPMSYVSNRWLAPFLAAWCESANNATNRINLVLAPSACILLTEGGWNKGDSDFDESGRFGTTDFAWSSGPAGDAYSGTDSHYRVGLWNRGRRHASGRNILSVDAHVEYFKDPGPARYGVIRDGWHAVGVTDINTRP